MRLIDADRLLRDMKASCTRNCKDCQNATFLSNDEHCGLIDDQPTAYDVDKVVEQLEERKQEMLDEDNIYVIRAIYGEAIDIVKEGVIDE